MKVGDSLNINLLPSQAKFQADKIRLKKTIRRYEMRFLGVWLVFLIGAFILFLGSGIILSGSQKKYQQAVNVFESNTEEIVLNQLLKYQAKALGQVLNERFEYAASFEKVASIFSDKAKVSDFEINDQDKSFTMTVTTADKEGIDYVEDRVDEVNEGKVEGVKKIIITGVSYQVRGEWSINLEVMI
ncbi:MAG TPA: hypothetical protein PKI92_03480 [Candidatus Woesebacteria bacterium]|nr:hypothetical protein [Candidatus Woesebacteria bacterium]HPR99845.1 hypothetical protein [Candidatus Woesebacteria bacterium]